MLTSGQRATKRGYNNAIGLCNSVFPPRPSSSPTPWTSQASSPAPPTPSSAAAASSSSSAVAPNDSLPAAMAERAKDAEGRAVVEATATGSKQVAAAVDSAGDSLVFPGHNACIVAGAKVCRERGLFTDVTIVVDDGSIDAHRLVLASCSEFLRDAFLDLPEGMTDASLMLPGVNKAIASVLVEFLYTGRMSFSKEKSQELQDLFGELRIDPDNVSIAAASTLHSSGDDSKTSVRAAATDRLRQPKITSVLKSSSTGSPRPDSRPMPLRLKRRASQQDDRRSSGSPAPEGLERKKLKVLLPGGSRATSSKEEKSSSSSSAPLHVIRPALTAASRGGFRPRRRGRPSSSGGTLSRQQQPRSSPSAAAASTSGSSGGDVSKSGVHDMLNVETWVCAICQQYDPVLPADVDPNEARNTDWIGCDCNRWFHIYCTRLGDSTKDMQDFGCAKVNLECLPAEGNK